VIVPALMSAGLAVRFGRRRSPRATALAWIPNDRFSTESASAAKMADEHIQFRATFGSIPTSS
jgi:hypothetical protein